MRSNLSLRGSVEILLFLLLFFTYGYFSQGGQHNENARFDQIRSVVESGSLAIDQFSYNTADLIDINGRRFPNKPPGTTFIGVPIWWLLGLSLSSVGFTGVLWEHLLCYLTSWFSIGAASALCALILFRLILKRTSSIPVALALAIAYGLGTIAFPFSTMFFGHQLGAAAVLGAFAIFYLEEENSVGNRKWRQFFFAGILLAFGLCVEYSNVFALIPIVCFGMWRWGRQLVFPVVVGIGIGSIPHLGYNWMISGNPFFLTHSAYQELTSGPLSMHAKGFLGVRLPTWDGLVGILFSPQRGLFYCNPWLILVVPALLVQIARRKIQSADVACLLIWVLFILFNAGFGDSVFYWGGGNSIGPRYIIASLPFLVFIISPLLLYRSTWFLFIPIALISIAFMLMATAVEPRASLDFADPVLGFYWPFYQQGRLAVGLSGVFTDQLITRDSVAFNWGKMLGFSGAYQLWPLLVFWLFMLHHLVKKVVSSKPVLFCAGGFFVLFALVPLFHLYTTRVATSGLTGRYLRGIVWGSAPTAAPLDPSALAQTELARVDPTLAFDWTTLGRPVVGHFSVEWRGTLRIEQSADYVFATESDDGSAVFIDGALVVDNWGEHGRQRRSGMIHLVPGEYSILVRYYDKGFGSVMQLLWGVYGEEVQVMPQRVFRPAKE